MNNVKTARFFSLTSKYGSVSMFTSSVELLLFCYITQDFYHKPSLCHDHSKKVHMSKRD